MEIVIALMVVMVALTAPWWGSDSRDGRDWQPRADWQVREELGRARHRAATR